MAPGRALGLALLLCHGVIAGPLGPAAEQTQQLQTQAQARPKLHGRFLHITDIHPDEYYKVHSSTDEDGACHWGEGPAGPYGAETTDCDSPFSLVNATFDWIAANLRDSIDFVVWTGDSARHDRDEGLPRNADQVLGTNTWIADKFADLFADDDAQNGMAVPVVPTFGNNDILPHNILLPGPNKWFHQYAHIWRRFIPEHQRHSFEFGGWFHVEVIPDRLAVFSLNTLYFFDRNAGVNGCADPREPGYKQMEWLRVQLQFLRERGMKAILMGHVPPARTESKTLWDETCWQRYSLWLHQFRDVVVVGLYGHMNIDHFLIHDKEEIDIAAALSDEMGTREAMSDELSVRSASDYLSELRDGWAKLTPPPKGGKSDEVKKDGKKRKGKKKRKDPWGERYHLSLVGPSVVPTYFPTLRVLEYNITGLEDALLWKDAPQKPVTETTSGGDPSQNHLDLRNAPIEINTNTYEDDDVTLTKKKKNDKPKSPQDPNLHIPAGPSKSALPGPAYSPQPLTLTGYTQYFANLTYINNLRLTPASTTSAADKGVDSSEEEESWWTSWLPSPLRWRSGKHGGRRPVVEEGEGEDEDGGEDGKGKPRPFAFEVEYSTSGDRVYKLADLTVNSMVRLAVRIGADVGGKGLSVAGEEKEAEEREEGTEGKEEDGDEDTDDDDNEVDVEKKKKHKKKKEGRKGKKKKDKENKAWLLFLKRAFVMTLDEDELENLA